MRQSRSDLDIYTLRRVKFTGVDHHKQRGGAYAYQLGSRDVKNEHGSYTLLYVLLAKPSNHVNLT